jgi:hypothetical protein
VLITLNRFLVILVTVYQVSHFANTYQEDRSILEM